MQTKTFKVLALAVLTLVMLVGGTVFAASQRLAELQSWPRALGASAPVLFVQVVLGIRLGTAHGTWRGSTWVVSLLLLFVAFAGYTWELVRVPRSPHWYLVWENLAIMIAGGMVFGELLKECLVKRTPLARQYKLPKGHPSLN